MNISLFCEFVAIGKASCSITSEQNLNFVAEAKSAAGAYLLGVSNLRPAPGNVKCQKWDYGWLVLRSNGSVFAFKFPHPNLPDIYRYEVPFDFSSNIVDISASGKYVVGIKSDGSLVEWYAPMLPSGVPPSRLSLPSGTLLSAVGGLQTDTTLTSLEFESLPLIKPGDLHGMDPKEAAILAASRNLIIDPVGSSYPYTSGEQVTIIEHKEGSREVTVSRYSRKAHAAGVRWVVDGPPPVQPAQPTAPSANQLAYMGVVLNRIHGSFLPAGNDFIQVCVAQGQGGLGDGPVFGLAVRQDGTVAQWGWFDGSLKGIPSEHSWAGIEYDTKISGLAGVVKVEVSAYSTYRVGEGSGYSCNAAALLEDGMVVTWSPGYDLGWYDPSKTPAVPRTIGWGARAIPWNVAFWESGAPSGTPDPAQPFRVGGVHCQYATGSYYYYITNPQLDGGISFANLSDINTWANLLPGYNATQDMVNRVAGVAGSIEYRGRFYVSPPNVRVEDLASFSGGYNNWASPSGQSTGYKYLENVLRMVGTEGFVHTVGAGGTGSSMAPEMRSSEGELLDTKNWLWAVNDLNFGSYSVARIRERLGNGPQLLRGIKKVFVSRKMQNVDHMYLKEDGALLSFELDQFNQHPFFITARFPPTMRQRNIPNELKITIWPDDSKSNEFTKVYDGSNRVDGFHNYGRVSGVDIVKVNITAVERSGLPASIYEIYRLGYISDDKSYLLHPSTGSLTVNYGIPEITRHNGNGCEQSGDYWFSPGFAGDCRPSNLQFKVVAGQMLDVPIFFNQTTLRPVSNVSANNLPAWASLTVYEKDKVKSMLNFWETIDGNRVNYYQVRPLVRLSGIPDNVGFPQVIPFTLTASNSSGGSEAEFTIFVSNIVEIDAEIITSCFFSGAFICLKNFYVFFRCAASIDSTVYAEYSAFPNEGEDGEVYEALDSGKTYLWDGVGYVETLARDLLRGADSIDLNIVSSGGLHVGGSWYFYGDTPAAFQANSQLVGRLQTISLTRFAYGEFNAVPGSRALVFYYTTLNGRITPQPLLSLGVSFFDNDEPEYKEAFIAPRAFDYVSPMGNSVAESEIQIAADGRYGIYNIWADKDLPLGDVKAHVAINLVRG